MKLKEKKINVETDGEFKEMSFTIGNVAFVLEILRSKLYSNPVKAICQEIMTNARDAHRELGNADRPIKITLPNEFDENFRVRDFGVGISPERMQDVFINYGNSTKRDSDNETGGFGIGAKTPFAYGDSFQIITVNPEDGKNIRREYIAVIDESRCGKVALASEGVTKEDRGTEIVVPVAKKDFSSFRKYATKACRWWDVIPEFVGITDEELQDCLELSKPKAVGNDGDWRILDTGWNTYSYIILDGIEYELNYDSFYSFLEEDKVNEIEKICDRNSIVLMFETGDLYITANRESVDYNKDACELIYERMKKMIKEVSVDFINEIANATSMMEAASIFEEKNIFNFPRTMFEWNGRKIASTNYRITCLRYERDNKTETGKPKKEKFYNVRISSSGLVLYTNKETDNPQVGRIYTAFQENADVNVIYIIEKGCDQQYEEDYGAETEVLEEKYEKHIFKNKKVVGSGATQRVVKTGNAWLLDTWYSSRDLEKVEIDTEDGSGYFVVKNRNEVHAFGRTFRYNNFMRIVRDIVGGKTKVYGVNKATAERLGDGWVNIQDKIVKIKEGIEKSKLIKKYGLNIDEYSFYHRSFDKKTIHTNVKKSSDFTKLRNQYLEIKKVSNSSTFRKALLLNELGVEITVPKGKSVISEDIVKKYPLLSQMYLYTLDKGVGEEIAFYINSVDERNKSKKSA